MLVNLRVLTSKLSSFISNCSIGECVCLCGRISNEVWLFVPVREIYKREGGRGRARRRRGKKQRWRKRRMADTHSDVSCGCAVENRSWGYLLPWYTSPHSLTYYSFIAACSRPCFTSNTRNLYHICTCVWVFGCYESVAVFRSDRQGMGRKRKGGKESNVQQTSVVASHPWLDHQPDNKTFTINLVWMGQTADWLTH